MLNTAHADRRLNRVAVIGCGHVGSASAFALLASGVAQEIVLVDTDEDRLEGEVMDLQHAVPLLHPVKVWGGDYRDVAAADIAVITAGASSKPGQSRLDLLRDNGRVTSSIVKEMMDAGFDGVILMTTNPVDVLAQIAQRHSGLPVERVISSGTVLDTARLRSILGEELGIESRSIHAYIIGEHGDSEIATWSSATVAGVPLREFAKRFNIDFDAVLERVRRAAPKIVEKKGYTATAIATSVARICEAILRDESTVLPVSTLTSGQYGISDVYLSLPCVVGRRGVESVIEIPLDDEELRGIRASAKVLSETLAKVLPD